MNEQFLKEIAARSLNEPVYPDPRFPPSRYYRFLKLLATEMKPNLSVELGVSGGGGSLHLCLGWPQGTVVGVDLAWDHAERVDHIRGQFSNFIFLQEDSVLAAKEIYDVYGPMDILFIDTIHEFERTVLEFETYRPYIADDGVICLDDLYRPGMQEAWEYLQRYGESVRLDYLHTGAANGGGFGCFFNVKRRN